MEIFFSPEIITPAFQVLNVVNSDNQAVGNVALLFAEKQIYVYGISEKEEVGADFKDLVTHYLKGLGKAKPDLQILACIYIGCKKVTLQEKDDEKS